jgi:hypothetical protein
VTPQKSIQAGTVEMATFQYSSLWLEPASAGIPTAILPSGSLSETPGIQYYKILNITKVKLYDVIEHHRSYIVLKVTTKKKECSMVYCRAGWSPCLWFNFYLFEYKCSESSDRLSSDTVTQIQMNRGLLIHFGIISIVQILSF